MKARTEARRTNAAGLTVAFMIASLLLTLLTAGCEDDELWEPPPRPAAGADGGVDGGARDGAAADAAKELPRRELTESDFSETEKNRDPFRNFASLFAQQAKGRTVVQRQVVIERYALDELTLTGIVTRGPARALFTDPASVGWIVKVGDYVGKPEIVRAGGAAGVDIAINWRVDRIRDGDVVFVREDPAHPEIAPVTRVVSLFPSETERNQGRR